MIRQFNVDQDLERSWEIERQKAVSKGCSLEDSVGNSDRETVKIDLSSIVKDPAGFGKPEYP